MYLIKNVYDTCSFAIIPTLLVYGVLAMYSYAVPYIDTLPICLT